MSISNWKTIAGHIQGDVSYLLRKSIVTHTYVDFNLILFSEKWSDFDIAFEYRVNAQEQWRTDAIITSASAKYLNNNKLYSMRASKYGTINNIRWEYIKNYIQHSSSPDIRIKILPRIRMFGSALSNYSITSVYGDKFSDIYNLTDRKCIGYNNIGEYICLTNDSLLIYPNLSSHYNYSFNGLSSPYFAIQINNNNYIIADTGNNRVIEINPTTSLIVKTYNINFPIYFDFSEDNETLLIINGVNGIINEISWSIIDYGTLLWKSSWKLNSPECVRYKEDDVNKIIIADTGNNRIIKYDKLTHKYDEYYHYKISDTYNGPYDISNFYKPYRVFWYSDNTFAVIEKEGKLLSIPVSITVIEPTASSVLSVGIPFTIKWTSIGITCNVTIEWWIDDGNGLKFKETITESTINNGSYNYIFSTCDNHTNNYIKVINSCNTSIYGFSEPFILSPCTGLSSSSS